MAAPMRFLYFVNKCQNARLMICQSIIRQCLRGAVVTAANGNTVSARSIANSAVLYSKSPVSASEVKKKMESLTDKFAEARELLDDARESKGTVYFSEDMEEAQEAVGDTLKEYSSLLDSLSSEQRRNVMSTLGLRMEELKAQQAAMQEDHDH